MGGSPSQISYHVRQYVLYIIACPYIRFIPHSSALQDEKSMYAMVYCIHGNPEIKQDQEENVEGNGKMLSESGLNRSKKNTVSKEALKL